MKRFSRLFPALLLLAMTFFALGANAQSGKGAIAGHVMDSSGGVLQGAEIELQPNTIKTASGPQGEYFINDLPSGTYTITVTYVGFSLFTKVVQITAGQTVTVDAAMQVASTNDQVLVTAERPSGEAEEVNRQRTADNVLQVLTNEVITSLPNANIADAVGRRFGTKKKFGALLGFSYDFEGRGIDDVEPVPDILNYGMASQQRYFDEMDIREYKYYRSRWGLAGSTDYQLGEGSNIYLRGMFSNFHNFGDRWVYSIYDNSGLNLLNAPSPTGASFTPSFNNSIRRPRYTIENLVLGGKHVLGSTWFSWDISGSFASENDNGYGGGSFGVPYASTYTSPCTYDPVATGNSLAPRWSQACYTEAYNPSLFDLNDVNISRGKTAQTNFQVAGAMGKRYHIGSHLSTIEIGGKFRNANKYDHSYTDDYAIPLVGGKGSDQNDFAPGAALIPFSMFPSTFHNSNYYKGIYPQGPFADYYKTQAYVLANTGDFVFTTGAAGAPNFYSYVEQVSAGYVMNTIDFSKFRFIAGVRVEGTNLNALSWQNGCTDPDPTICPTIIQPGQNLKAGGDYITVLPSSSLRYALTSNTNFRLVYSRGLSRPNPQDIAQSFSITPAQGGKG